MSIRRLAGCSIVMLVFVNGVFAASADLADAVMKGNKAAVRSLLQKKADVNAAQSDGTTALHWAARLDDLEMADLLIHSGANVSAATRGGATPLELAAVNGSAAMIEKLIKAGADVNPRLTKYGDTALMMAARADVNTITADGKGSLELAIYNGNYEIASFLIDNKANLNHADAEGFTPLFWAVDRRNMETNPGMPWMVTADPFPLIKKLLASGANPNAFVDNIPTSRRSALNLTPRTTFATALPRAAFSADLELVELLLSYGADPNIASSHAKTALMQAAGYAWIDGYSRGKSNAERLQVIKLLVELGANVNAADDMGITALMAAGHLGDPPIIQYLIDRGADLGAHALGKKNDGQFGGGIEPLSPIDYARGVGTFRPNNSIVGQ